MDRIGQVRAADAAPPAAATAEPVGRSTMAGTPTSTSTVTATATAGGGGSTHATAPTEDGHDGTPEDPQRAAVEAVAAAYESVLRRPGVDAAGGVTVGRTGATVGLHVSTHGADTRAWVEWGRGGAAARAGDVAVPASCDGGGQGVRLSGLLPDTVYSFRVVASSRSGMAYGPVQSFRTQS